MVISKLKSKLKSLKAEKTELNSITFAGNGEPTLHPDFANIIDATIKLRNEYYPSCPISVLSNAMMLHKTNVVEALKKIEKPILKLDAGTEKTFQLIDRPLANRSLSWIVKNLKKFEGKALIQTMFLKGSYEEEKFDNTTEEEISAWLEILKDINPSSVMLYSIDRNTPTDTLQKINKEELIQIAERVKNAGFEVQVN